MGLKVAGQDDGLFRRHTGDGPAAAEPPGAAQDGTPASRLVPSPNDPLPGAQQFVDEQFAHPERPLLLCQGGSFYRWDGACWPEVEDAQLRTDLYRYFAAAVYLAKVGNEWEQLPFQPNRRKIADLVDALRAGVHLPIGVTTPAWLDGDGPVPADELISCANGVLHWPSRTLRPLTPRLYVHHSVPFSYEAGAPAPKRWLAFLNELWPDDASSVDAVREIFGYLISGDTKQQKMFLVVGPKRAGKGTVGRVAKGLLGAHNLVAPTLAGLATNFGLAPLIGKPVAVIADARLRSGDSIVTERLLSISGEDTLTVDRKFRDPWTGRLPTRFVVLTNELPRLADSSGALASRFVVLTLTRSFYGAENPLLTEELLQELPGILNWSLDGLESLRARGHFVQPKSSEDAIRALEDLGSPITAFLRERCQVGPAHSVIVPVLFERWRQWCDEQGQRPGSVQQFGKDLRAQVPGLKTTQPRSGGVQLERHYQGVGLA